MVWCGGSGGNGGGGDGVGGSGMSRTVVTCGSSRTMCDVPPPPCTTCNDEAFVVVRDLTFKPEVRGAVNRPETADTALRKPVTIFETAGNVDVDFSIDSFCKLFLEMLWSQPATNVVVPKGVIQGSTPALTVSVMFVTSGPDTGRLVSGFVTSGMILSPSGPPLT
jgi:hypothetical protein